MTFFQCTKYSWLPAYTLHLFVWNNVEHAIDASPSSCHASHQLEDSNVSHLQSYASVFSSRLFSSPTKRALRILAEIFRLMFFQTEWNGKKTETSNHLESILKISKLSSKKNGWFWKFASEISKGGRCYPWAGDPQCEELLVISTEGMFVGGFFQGKHPKTCFFCRKCCLGPAGGQMSPFSKISQLELAGLEWS